MLVSRASIMKIKAVCYGQYLWLRGWGDSCVLGAASHDVMDDPATHWLCGLIRPMRWDYIIMCALIWVTTQPSPTTTHVEHWRTHARTHAHNVHTRNGHGTCADTCKDTYTHMHTCIHTCTHTCTHKLTHSQTRIHAQTQTPKYKHANTRTHIHIQEHPGITPQCCNNIDDNIHLWILFWSERCARVGAEHCTWVYFDYNGSLKKLN